MRSEKLRIYSSLSPRRPTFSLKDEGEFFSKQEQEKYQLDNKCFNQFYVYNQPSSISKRELPFLGPVRTGEGARD